MLAKCTGSFVIGLFAGICAVFVPRMGGLLVADDLDKISLFPTPFLLLGVAYAAIVGAILVILYYDRKGTPRDRFMAALGIPALLAGALATSAQTGKVQQLQATAEKLSNAVVLAEKIRKDDKPADLVPLTQGLQPSSSDAGFERLLGIGSAHARMIAVGGPPQQNALQFPPIQVNEHRYAVLVGQTPSEDVARKKAQELRPLYPNAQAVKSGSGFGVVTDVKPESAAVLEAIRMKRETGVSPQLIRVK